MRLTISHSTRYLYDAPVPYALSQIRLRPKAHGSQQVLSWDVAIEGGRVETRYEDYHRNGVDLVSTTPGATALTITVSGVVETTDTAGVLGPHGAFVPLWLFLRPTLLTKPGAGVNDLARSLKSEKDTLAQMHGLMTAIADRMAYRTGTTDATTSAEVALAAEQGVCQDMAHVFVSAARTLGVPARYVSGYLLMGDRVAQDAAHAWAEAHVEGLGWVGFDIANRMCPNDGYIRVATGLDYAEAAPVSGMRRGNGTESLEVHLTVSEDAGQSQAQSGKDKGQDAAPIAAAQQ